MAKNLCEELIFNLKEQEKAVDLGHWEALTILQQQWNDTCLSIEENQLVNKIENRGFEQEALTLQEDNLKYLINLNDLIQKKLNAKLMEIKKELVSLNLGQKTTGAYKKAIENIPTFIDRRY